MENFLIENFFSILCSVVAFCITYILKNINLSIKDLRKDYTHLILSRDETKATLQKDIQEIKVLIAGAYVSKNEFAKLLRAELYKMDKEEHHENIR